MRLHVRRRRGEGAAAEARSVKKCKPDCKTGIFSEVFCEANPTEIAVQPLAIAPAIADLKLLKELIFGLNFWDENVGKSAERPSISEGHAGWQMTSYAE